MSMDISGDVLMILLTLTIVGRTAESSTLVSERHQCTFHSGETITLPCMPNVKKDVDWRHQDSDTSPVHYVYTNGVVYDKFQARFSVDNSTAGHYDLIISSIAIADAGLYICIEDGGFGAKHIYELVVSDDAESGVKCPATAAVATTTAGTSSDNMAGTAAGVSVAIICALIIIAVLLYLLYRARKRRRHSRPSSREVDHFLPVPTRPEPPSNFDGTSKTSNSITFSWHFPDCGAEVRFTIKYRPHASDKCSEERDITELQFTVTGLEPETPYTAYVVASNNVGSSQPSNCCTVITLTDDDSMEFANKIARLRPKLLDIIETDFGLLNELFSRSVITHPILDRVRAGEMAYDRTGRLLDCLTTSLSEQQYNELLSALQHTLQPHVANLIRENGDIGKEYGDVRPLTDAQRSVLSSNYARLVELINLRTSGLIDELVAVRCISSQQRDHIMSSTDGKRGAGSVAHNERLLDILLRRSVADFHKFVESLEKTGQAQLAAMLKKGGVVAFVETKLDENGSSADEVMHLEQQIVSQFRKLRSSAQDPIHLDKQSAKMAAELNIELRKLGFDIEIIELRERNAVPSGSSVVELKTNDGFGVYVMCGTADALKQFVVLNLERHFGEVLEGIFSKLTDKKVVVVQLKWVQDYPACRKHFSEVPEPSVTYVNVSKMESKPDSISQPVCLMDKFPAAQLRFLLLKTFRKIYYDHHKSSARPDREALQTLKPVCRGWWKVMLHLQASLRPHVAKYVPEYFGNLKVNGAVCGIAFLNDEIFLCTDSSKSIAVFAFRGKQISEKLHDVSIKDLTCPPRDIVACSKNRLLFVADAAGQRVWQVEKIGAAWKPADRAAVSKLDPISLSLNDGRLLVIEKQKLTLYVIAERRSSSTSLKDLHMSAEHAIESSNSTFIVAYMGADGKYGIAEINRRGGWLRVADAECFRRPTYLVDFYADEPGGRILVADAGHCQVLLMNSELEVARVLLDARHSGLDVPQRVWHSTTKTGYFLVGQLHGTVSVYWPQHSSLQVLE